MERQEFERLANKYLDVILRILLHFCASREDAEDVVQDAFVKLWNREERFDSDEDARRWLIRVAINESRSLWRGRARRPMVPFEELAEEPGIVSEDYRELYEAIRKLPVKYRQVICLYYLEGYKAGEIADMLGRTETAVQTQLLRARRKLKKELGEEWQ